MSGAPVLLYAAEGASESRLAQAVLDAGCEPRIVRDLEGLSSARLADLAGVVMMLDDEALGQVSAVAERLERSTARPRMVLVGCEHHDRCLAHMLAHPSICHVIAARPEAPDGEQVTAALAQTTRGGLLSIDRLLPQDLTRHHLTVSDARDKAEYVRLLASFAQRVGCGERAVELVETVVDELCTNAIFNAPRNADGSPRYAHKNRRESVSLRAEERAELSAGFDGRFYVVSVSDPFGALTREVAVTHMEHCIRQLPERRPGAGGAGMGLFRVLGACSRIIFNLEPGRRTEVIGMVDVQQSMKSFKLQAKSLHFFVGEESL